MNAATINRRGACPTLAAPMKTGDGLLARISPEAAGLTPEQIKGLASSASHNGNGIIEITARGSLQIRGLSAETVPGLAADIDGLGIVPRVGPAVETSPLAGLDLTEIKDLTAEAASIRDWLARENLSQQLAPKVSVVLNGGGSLGLERLTADIRLDPIQRGDKTLWRVGLGGTSENSVADELFGEPQQAVARMGELIRELALRGPDARGRDLAGTSLAGSVSATAQNASARTNTSSLIALTLDQVAVSIVFPFGSVDASRLGALAERAWALEVVDLRPAPHRRLLARCADLKTAEALARCAVELGFILDQTDPRLAIAACPGAPACASGQFETRKTADAIAMQQAEIAQIGLHVSGCAKGCAHPAVAPITLVGSENGVGLVVNGTARDAPLAYCRADKLHEALARLAALAAKGRNNGLVGASALPDLPMPELAQAFAEGSE